MTGKPQSNAATVIPAPIVPPPTTPSVSSFRGFARLASGILELDRSAKKACIIPFDWFEARHSRKFCRSIARPS